MLYRVYPVYTKIGELYGAARIAPRHQVLGNRSSSGSPPSYMVIQSGESGLVSDYVRLIFQSMNFAVICELIDILGTISNIINIICFVKQGFKDPVNVTLLGLTVSDLGCLVTLVWHNICFNPLFHDSSLPFDSIEMQYLTGGWPHVIFTRVTSWITALIIVERCLCVIVPLKVKSIVTPKRCTIIIICMFVILIGSVSPVYYSNRIGWKFFPGRNKNLLGLVYTKDRAEVEKVSFAINNIFIPFSSFITVIIATVLLVVKLKSKTEWRKQSTAQENSDSASSRDQRVSKMVIMISAMFIVCFTPICIIFIAMTIEPEFSISGKYHNMFFITFSFGYILESANSSLNIFVYYKMSSRYRAVFNELFSRSKTTQIRNMAANT